MRCASSVILLTSLARCHTLPSSVRTLNPPSVHTPPRPLHPHPEAPHPHPLPPHLLHLRGLLCALRLQVLCGRGQAALAVAKHAPQVALALLGRGRRGKPLLPQAPANLLQLRLLLQRHHGPLKHPAAVRTQQVSQSGGERDTLRTGHPVLHRNNNHPIIFGISCPEQNQYHLESCAEQKRITRLM